MKDMKKNSLLSSIIFFVLGIILFTRPDALVKFISYLFGGVLIVVGLYKSANYYIQDKRLGVVNRNEIAFGITAIVLGVIFIVLASAIEFLIRIVFGFWMILEGITKITNTFYTTDRSSKFYALMVTGFIFAAAGVYTIASSNLALKVIGLFMIIYGVMDFATYFINVEKSDVSSNIKEEIVKEISTMTNDEEVKEAEIVEEEKSKKKTKSKGSKKTKK